VLLLVLKLSPLDWIEEHRVAIECECVTTTDDIIASFLPKRDVLLLVKNEITPQRSTCSHARGSKCTDLAPRLRPNAFTSVRRGRRLNATDRYVFILISE